MKKLLLFCLLFTYTLTNSQTLLETINLPSGTFHTSAYGMVYNNGKFDESVKGMRMQFSR